MQRHSNLDCFIPLGTLYRHHDEKVDVAVRSTLASCMGSEEYHPLLPNSLPNSFDITQLPLGGFLPPGVPAASKAFTLVFRPQFFQNAPDHVCADIRASVLKLCHAERPESAVDSVSNQACFLAPKTLKLTEALLKFPICHLDDRKKVIDMRPGTVFALVPPLGALLQGFGAPFFVLLDQTQKRLSACPNWGKKISNAAVDQWIEQWIPKPKTGNLKKPMISAYLLISLAFLISK